VETAEDRPEREREKKKKKKKKKKKTMRRKKRAQISRPFRLFLLRNTTVQTLRVPPKTQRVPLRLPAFSLRLFLAVFPWETEARGERRPSPFSYYGDSTD
jgi:hypothetical protein